MDMFKSGNPNSMMMLALLNTLESSGYITTEDKLTIISVGEDCLKYYGRYPRIDDDPEDNTPSGSCSCGGSCLH
jgi:hypothetical protein